MTGAPKTYNVCQPPGSATIIANNGTTIERPVKSPAMKLRASRSLTREFFMIDSDRENDGLASYTPLRRLTAK